MTVQIFQDPKDREFLVIGSGANYSSLQVVLIFRTAAVPTACRHRVKSGHSGILGQSMQLRLCINLPAAPPCAARRCGARHPSGPCRRKHACIFQSWNRGWSAALPRLRLLPRRHIWWVPSAPGCPPGLWWRRACRGAAGNELMPAFGPPRPATLWRPTVAFGALRTWTGFYRATIFSEWPRADLISDLPASRNEISLFDARPRCSKHRKSALLEKGAAFGESRYWR